MRSIRSLWFRGLSIVLVVSLVAGLLVMLSPRVRIETTTGMVSISLGTQVSASEVEIVSSRTENSKVFDLGGGKRQLETHIGAIHYKDNYADATEPWKDIDLTWEGNRITKAPYELTRDDKKLTLKDKKTGEISTIELLSVKPAGIPFEVIPEFSAVKFQHILPNDKVPFEAQFKVTGKVPITRAFDDEGELELETTLVGDVLTENLSEIRDKKTGQIRPAKGQIRVDPTWQVGASSDDVRRRISAGYSWWGLTSNLEIGASPEEGDKQWGSGMRFTNITIPQGTTITQSYLTLRASSSASGPNANSRISAEDVDDAITFADDAAAFDTRYAARTTARVDWDNAAAWTINTDYNSPEIKTVIQEIVDRAGWVSGNDIVIFWEDFDNRTPQAGGNYREAYSYDGSTTYAPKLVITYPADPEITVSPTSYNFGVVAAGSSTNTTTIYFTIDNTSAMQTDQTISVTTTTWSGGSGWSHNDSGTPGDNATAILANRGGAWGAGDVIVKNAAPNFIYENCPASTDYSFGLGLWTPLTFYDGAEKTITVRVSAVAG